MRIKLFFTVMLFLSGMAVQFAGAMEERKQVLKLELVCDGKVTWMDRVDDDNIKFGLNYEGKLSTRPWPFKKRNEPCQSGDGMVKLVWQTSTIHLTPIIEATVADKTILTASYDKQKNKSWIKATPIPDYVRIKTGKRTVNMVATEKVVKTCCLSKTLLNNLVEIQGQDKEISLNLTEGQFDDAWNYMSGTTPQKLADMSINQLCDLIVADEVLKIKTDNENSLPKDCLNVIGANFDKCDTDAARGEYYTQVERLSQVHQRTIALHIAKDFINQSKDGEKYSATKLHYNLPGICKTEIRIGELSLCRDPRDNKVMNIVVKKDGSSYQERLKHDSEIKGVAISKEGNTSDFPARVVTLAGNKVTVWSLEDGEAPSYCGTILNPAPGGIITDIDITGDGKFVAAATLNKYLQIWDLETGSCFLVFNYSFKGVDQIRFGQDNDQPYIYIMDGSGYGNDKEINLNSFFARVELVKRLNVRLACLVNKQKSIDLTEAEYKELVESGYENDIKKYQIIRLEKTAEIQLIQKQNDIKQDDSNQQNQIVAADKTQNNTNQNNPAQQNQTSVVTEIKSDQTDEKLPDQIETKKKNDKRTSNKFSSLTNYLPTFNNFIKGSFLTIGAFSILYLIFHSMNH